MQYLLVAYTVVEQSYNSLALWILAKKNYLLSKSPEYDGDEDGIDDFVVVEDEKEKWSSTDDLLNLSLSDEENDVMPENICTPENHKTYCRASAMSE